jgi:hypothetical protein
MMMPNSRRVSRMTDELYTIDQAANICKVEQAVVRLAIRHNELRAWKQPLADDLLVMKSDLLAWGRTLNKEQEDERMMPNERLAEIRDLEAGATPGPWSDEITNDGVLLVNLAFGGGETGYCDVLSFGDMEVTTKYDHANAAFIATARTIIPELLSEVDTLRGVVNRMIRFGFREDMGR